MPRGLASGFCLGVLPRGFAPGFCLGVSRQGTIGNWLDGLWLELLALTIAGSTLIEPQPQEPEKRGTKNSLSGRSPPADRPRSLTLSLICGA